LSKIGFFGGSFNPPTIAHLEIVKRSLDEFSLDKVVVVPMGDKYEKKDLLPFKYRFNMLEIMFEDFANVEISALQVNQQERTYAIDTFSIIDKVYSTDERFFIMGLDNFSNIKKWKNSSELLNNRKYIVFKRNNIIISENIENIYFLDMGKNISSTDVRQKIKLKEDVKNLLPKNVFDYIDQNGLYK
jgi:nicotinate-nucleotide adenylyltransferase